MKNVMKNVMISDIQAYYGIYRTIKSTDILKGWRAAIRKKN